MHRIFTSIIFLCGFITAFSQDVSTPVAYMEYFTSREAVLSENYLSYMSQVAHGRRARKLEKRRQELLTSIRQASNDANKAKAYKGDASLRDVYRTYWDILYKVFNEDYHKIVDMEEIAEQSYDNMEAYLLAQQRASEVLDKEQDKIQPVFRDFAKRNNITLQETETKMTKKLQQVGEVNVYSNKVFLIFFKSFKQEVYVIDAFNRKDINSIEQNRNTLTKFAEEGLSKLDTLKAFHGDGSLSKACRQVLEFHRNEAEKLIPVLGDFLVKSDEFEKTRKSFDAKPESKRTQTDIDNYNAIVKQYNAAVASSNQTLNNINNGSKKASDHWETVRKRFMEQHIPK
jgi:hypothetical protein